MANSVFCVNTPSEEFKDTAKRLDVSEGQLETTLHEYFNREDVTDKETYPSDEYLKEQWQGKPFVGSGEQVELLDKYYSKPIFAETQSSVRALVEHLSQFFPIDSIGIKQKNNGSFEVKVNDYAVEIANIKKKAIADGTFMKAPNGKDSNLNEQQWLQVRTKAFKNWFGDWENDPANASKVVDENGEPLVVYTGVPIKGITKFSLNTPNRASLTSFLRKGIYFSDKDTASLYTKGKPVYKTNQYVNEEQARKIDIWYYGEGSFNEDAADFVGLPIDTITSYINEFTSEVTGELDNYYIPRGEVIPAFLNIKNPVTADAGGRVITKLTKNDVERINNSEGAIVYHVDEHTRDDLTITDSTDYIVFDPNQIKSAVNNDGTFTVGDSNIYQEGEGQNQNQARDTRLDELIKKEDVSIVDLLSLVDDSSEYSGIIELLKTKKDGRKPLLEGIQVKLVEGNRSGIFDKSRAFYNAKNRTIYINTLGNYRGGRADSVIMHEVMHAITVNRILGNKGYRAEFDKIISEYQDNFFNIRYSKNGLNKEMASHYMEEFIADVWSNIDTINNLKKININTKQTLWDRIKNFFTKIFKGSDGTLMAQASDAIYRLLDQPELVSASGSYYEGETPQRQVLESIRPSLQKDFIEATKKSKQIDAMLSSDVITSTDISDAALIVSNWISDIVTLYQTNPEKLFENFDTLERKNNWATEEDKKADLDAVSKLSRKEIVEKIGTENLLERAKFEVFKSEAIDDVEAMEQADFFFDNFDGLLTYISPLVSTTEDFVLKSVDEEGFESKVATVNDEVFGEESEPIDKESLDEVTRDMTEHWAVESRTLDVWKTATQEVRNALTQCYLLEEDKDNNGVTKTDEQGNKLYRPVRNKFAQKEHIKTLQATQQILHWVQGSLNSNDMVAKLEAKAEANPWVNQIIARLKDTSGKEADFRSQFFKTFYKPWTSYFVQLKNKKTNKIHTAPVNVTPALNQVVNEIKVSHNIGTHPLFTSTGINLTAFEKLSKYADNFKKGKDAKTFGKVTEDVINKEKLATAFANVSAILGYPVAVENVMLLLNESNFNSMTDAVVNIKNTLERNLNNNEYNPFKYGKDSINGYLKSFLSPIAESLEEIEKGSFYANGKMYQGYVTPSYTTKMMDKLTGDQEVFQQFITEEFANTEWFVEEVGLPFETLKTRASVWRNLTLQKLVSLSEEERRRFTGHKVVLNYQGNREYEFL